MQRERVCEGQNRGEECKTKEEESRDMGEKGIEEQGEEVEGLHVAQGNTSRDQ